MVHSFKHVIDIDVVSDSCHPLRGFVRSIRADPGVSARKASLHPRLYAVTRFAGSDLSLDYGNATIWLAPGSTWLEVSVTSSPRQRKEPHAKTDGSIIDAHVRVLLLPGIELRAGHVHSWR